MNYSKKIFYALHFLILIYSKVVIAAQTTKPILHYTVSFPQPSSHTYKVSLECKNWHGDTIILKMPNWTPGYYQLMDYSKSLDSISAKNVKGEKLKLETVKNNTWRLIGIRNKTFNVNYTIHTTKKFVANSYVDSTHAYIIPANSFMHIENQLHVPVDITIKQYKEWEKIATGLTPKSGTKNTFTAENFDILYDCPILIGNLNELPSFTIRGIKHRFIGHNIGNFDQKDFMNRLQKIVEAGINIIGDIPYNEYTFIAIGPGRGGIEHLNNTTFSFDGNGLEKPEAMNRMFNFLAHEYFHHYNVKRIRPLELGPFDYENGARTNQLWLSEGLTVYFEYLMVKRAGLADINTLFEHLEKNINAYENNPGKSYQSLQQASYNTWSDGPFGTQGTMPSKSISYYDKGPLIGMLLDFEIRNATENKKSLDDVMRLLYWEYYKQKNRGFTEAEFQSSCEEVAGIPLSPLFEYIYTTKELDYNKYLGFAGLELKKQEIESKDKAVKQKFRITRIENPGTLQLLILKSWLGE